MFKNKQRLHPAFMLVSFLATLREMLIPLLFLTLTGFKKGHVEWWNMLGIGAILFFTFVASIFRWWRYQYFVTAHELQIEHGLFVRKRRFIPFERIQSIHVTQGIVHRMFGLVKLQIETAGGTVEPEAQLAALTRGRAEQIREWIRQAEDGPAFMEDQDKDGLEATDYQWKLSKRALLIVASTSGGFGILFSFIVALMSQIEQLLPEHFFENVYNALISSSFVFISVLILFVAAIAWLVSFLSTLLRFGGFTLTKRQDEIVVERGLLEKRQLTIPLNKVQAVRIDEGMLRQPFDYAVLSVEIAGESGQDRDQLTIIHPLIKRSDVPAFLQKVLPTFANDAPLQAVPARARRRYILRNSWLFIVIVCALFLFIPIRYAVFSLGLLLIGMLLGFFKHKDAGWFQSGGLLSVRFRKLKRTTVLTLKKRVQSFEQSQSWFQRRRQLANFHMSVYGGLFGQTYTIEDMDVTKADELFHQLRTRK